MIVVDTNVVSELMRPEPATVVLRWFDMQFEDDIHLNATSAAELLAGVALMPAGRRQDNLRLRVDAMLETFGGRILPFGSAAARSYASIYATRRRAGRPIPRRAGVCRSASSSRRRERSFASPG